MTETDVSTVQINVPYSKQSSNELIAEIANGAYKEDGRTDQPRIGNIVGNKFELEDALKKVKTAHGDKPNAIQDSNLQNQKNGIKIYEIKENQSLIQGAEIVHIGNYSESRITDDQEETPQEVNKNDGGEIKDFPKSIQIDDITPNSANGEEETFYVDFSTLKPGLMNYEAPKQAFIPLSPNINQEELLKLLNRNDQTAYHQFQLQNPLKEVDKVEDNIESFETLRSAPDATVKATYINVDEGIKSDVHINRDDGLIQAYDKNYDNTRQGRLYGGIGKSRRRDQRNIGATKIGKPETTKDKFQVIRVYAEKPKSLDRNTHHQIITKTTNERSDDFYDFYNKWQEANNNKNNVNIDRTFEKIPLKEIEKRTAVEKLNDDIRKPKNELNDEELGLHDEVNIRDLIRKEIEKKMKNSRALKMKEEQLENIKRSDNAENVNLVNNSQTNYLEYKINEIENEVNSFKKNTTRNLFQNKVDKLFENIVTIVKKCNIDEDNHVNLNLFDCLKDQTLRTVQAAIFHSNKSVPIIQGFIYLENNLADLTNYSGQENRQLNYNQKFIQAINMFLNNLSLKVKLPTDLLLAESQAVARGKKDKHGHLLLLMLLLVAGTLIPIKMSLIAMVAGKALMISIVSLTLAVIIGLKKISHAGHGSGHPTYEVINVPASGSGHGISGGPTYISRNLKYTTMSTPALSGLSSYANPYSSYATSYDNEHEGEISPDTGDALTNPTTEERNYALPSDGERNYEEENELSGDGERHYVLPSGGDKHYALSSGDEKHYTVPIGGEKHYTVPLPSGEEKHYPPSDDERHYVASGGDKYTPSGGGDEKYYSFSRYGNKGGWLPSSGQAKRRNTKV
ncbi:hypothetical protein WDU94_002080 [Cyamophila willieti]